MMKSMTCSMPDLMLLVGTRVALGVGIGLLMAGRLDRSARIAAGCALATVGVLTTIPLALSIVGQRETAELKPGGRGRAGSESYAGTQVA
jgi:hypothetical protein